MLAPTTKLYTSHTVLMLVKATYKGTHELNGPGVHMQFTMRFTQRISISFILHPCMHSMYRRGKTVAVVNVVLTKLVKPDEYFACNNEHINMCSSWQVGLGEIENFLPRLLWSLYHNYYKYHGIEMNYSKYTQNHLHSIFAWVHFVYQLAQPQGVWKYQPTL